jgi:hypothetical protein
LKRRHPLGEVDANSLKRAHRTLSRWGCKQCDVALCNSDKCWYFIISKLTRDQK